MIGTIRTTMAATGAAGMTFAAWTAGAQAEDGIFSPASNLNSSWQRIFQDVRSQRLSVRILDIYVSSTGAVHSLNLYYRNVRVTAVPVTVPTVTANTQDTLVYAYAGRTDCNPFQQDDGTARRLTKPLVFAGNSGPYPSGADGALLFNIPVGAYTTAVVSVLWTAFKPGDVA